MPTEAVESMKTRLAEIQTTYESPTIREACSAALKLDIMPHITKRVKNSAVQLLYKLLDSYPVRSARLGRGVGLGLASSVS